jgi:hypothetical protein
MFNLLYLYNFKDILTKSAEEPRPNKMQQQQPTKMVPKTTKND